MSAGVAWLGVPASIVIGLVTCLLFTRESDKFEHYTVCIWLHGVACVVEMLSEPAYILALREMRFQLRLRVEGLAHLVRCVLTYLLLAHAGLGLLAFGIAQLAFSLVLVIGYYAFYFRLIQTGQCAVTMAALLMPLRSAAPDTAMLRLAGSFTWQTVQKFVLTEGVKIVLMVFVPLGDTDVCARARLSVYTVHPCMCRCARAQPCTHTCARKHTCACMCGYVCMYVWLKESRLRIHECVNCFLIQLSLLCGW